MIIYLAADHAGFKLKEKINPTPFAVIIFLIPNFCGQHRLRLLFF